MCLLIYFLFIYFTRFPWATILVYPKYNILFKGVLAMCTLCVCALNLFKGCFSPCAVFFVCIHEAVCTSDVLFLTAIWCSIA